MDLGSRNPKTSMNCCLPVGLWRCAGHVGCRIRGCGSGACGNDGGSQREPKTPKIEW